MEKFDFPNTFSCQLYNLNKCIHTFICPQTGYLLHTKISPVLPLTLRLLLRLYNSTEPHFQTQKKDVHKGES